MTELTPEALAEHDHAGPDWRCEACKPLADVLHARMRWPSLHWGNLHDDAFPSLARAVYESGWYAEMTAALAAEQARADRHGPCTCNTGPGTEGPDEFCPHHGRTYADVLTRWDEERARDTKALLESDRLRVDFAREQQARVKAEQERDEAHKQWHLRTNKAEARVAELEAGMREVRRLAEQDRRCPCCTGYDAILRALLKKGKS